MQIHYNIEEAKVSLVPAGSQVHAFAVKDGSQMPFDSNNQILLPACIKQELDTVLRSILGRNLAQQV